MVSKLAYKTSLSPNNSGLRKYPVTRITPHVVVGHFDAETVAGWFNKPDRKASANYIIGKDGKILCNCLEENRAWTSGDGDNDNRAITIECASDLNTPYALNLDVYNALIDLTVDICQRYKKRRIVWYDDKLLTHQPADDEMLITAHYFFQNVACFGQWLKGKMPDYVAKVNERLQTTEEPTPNVLYKVQCGAFKERKNAEKLRDELKTKGYKDAFIVCVGKDGTK